MVTQARKRNQIASYDANKPTAAAYGAIQAAYDFFNAELFGGELPQCLITLTRKKGAYGYFSPTRFSLVGSENAVDEIALNPMHFAERETAETLSTLVHEMVHLWQQHFGEPPRRCYHDRQWAAKMKSVGLWPSSTAAEGGKETGARVSHFIIEDGAYAAAYERWAAQVKTPLFQDVALLLASEKEAEKKAASKTKFTCPKCSANAWGKPDLHIVCGDCEVRMESEAT